MKYMKYITFFVKSIKIYPAIINFHNFFIKDHTIKLDFVGHNSIQMISRLTFNNNVDPRMRADTCNKCLHAFHRQSKLDGVNFGPKSF